MIVKIQKPLFSTVAHPGLLVYDQKRTFSAEITSNKALNKQFGPDVKMYCEATRDADGRLSIGKRVADQSW